MTYSAEVLADSPLAYWKLDETSGTSAADSSGNSRTATYTNSPTLGSTSLLVDGSGKAMTIATGSGQCTTIASASWMNVSALTVECLVKFTASVDNGSGDCVVARLTANLDWALVRNLDGTLQASVWNNSGTRFNAISSALTNNVIYHVAFTFDGTNLKLYINGSAAATTACSGTVATLADPIEIGRYSGSTTTSPAAVIDEVAIYGSGLSSGRISAHYTAATVASIVVSGDPFVCAATMQSGSALTAISVAGERFVSVATMLDGTATSGPVLISGDVFTVATTMLDGAAHTAILLSGEQFVSGAVFLDGQILAAPVPGSAFVAAVTMLGGGVLLPVGTDTSNAFYGRQRGGSATVEVTVPVVEPIGVATTRVDKAVPLPLPVLVKGRPT